MALGKTVAELESTLGAKEYDEWWQHYQEEPWGAYRDNMHAAMIVATLRNAFRGDSPMVYPKDFLLTLRTPEQELTAAMESLAKLEAIATPASKKARKRHDRSSKTSRKT